MYRAITANKRKTVYIMAIFVLLVVGFTWLMGAIYQDYSITAIALTFTFFYILWSSFASDKLALLMNGAHQIKKKDNPRLYRIVENLSITMGLPMPKVYVIQDAGMNAFATGRDPEHSSVAVTTGLMAELTDNELEGVMAHEMGHVKNYDIRVSLIAFGLVAVISLMCDFFLRMSFHSRRDNDSNSNAGAILLILGLVALIIAPIAASLLQMAISRRREYLADATGAMTTRYPEGLASALEKIGKHGSELRRQNTSTAHLFFANPLKRKAFANMFSTHPPIESRVKELRLMIDKV